MAVTRPSPGLAEYNRRNETVELFRRFMVSLTGAKTSEEIRRLSEKYYPATRRRVTCLRCGIVHGSLRSFTSSQQWAGCVCPVEA